MSHIVLGEEHIEVLYLLLNDEHDSKYYFPHYRATCIELANAGYMLVENRRTKEEMIKITPDGLRAFTRHFGTTNVMHAMKMKVHQKPYTYEHYDLLHKLITSNPIAATDIEKLIIAFDLVNGGWAKTIFTTSGSIYYTSTHQGHLAFCHHYSEYSLVPAEAKHRLAA